MCIYVRCTLKSNKDLIALSLQLQQILIKFSLGGPKSLRIIDIRTSNFVFVWKGEKCWMGTGMSISLKVSKKECKVSKPALPRQTNQKVVTSQTSHTNDFLSKQTGWGLFSREAEKMVSYLFDLFYLQIEMFGVVCLIKWIKLIRLKAFVSQGWSRWAVVVVLWSAFLLSSPTIRVQILLAT